MYSSAICTMHLKISGVTAALRTSLFLCAFVVFGLSAGVAQGQSVSQWVASSGILPDQGGCGAWSLSTTAPGPPVLGPDFLTISSMSALSEFQGYNHSDVDLILPASWWIEFECRLVSGTSTHVARAPIGVGFSRNTSQWNALWIGGGEAFLMSANMVRGQTAAIPTSDTFHTYRIEISGSAITVFYDGSQILAGSMVPNASAWPVPRIFWGEASGFTTGTSEWRRFEHNALSLNCPVSIEESTWGSIKARYVE